MCSRSELCRRCGALLLPLVLAGVGCEREERNFRWAQAADEGVAGAQGYDESAYAVAEGKHLYIWFNCVGCHAMGGGGMGPPLMDAAWRYGSHPADIFQTITDGRPNGMPAFGRRITEQQRWWLVAYVRSMSGLVPKDRRPGRSDAMHVKAPEVLRDRVEPRLVGPPPPPPGDPDTSRRIQAGPVPDTAVLSNRPSAPAPADGARADTTPADTVGS
jgi:cytochrome c oxidase cbb3-type subunit 3